MLIISRTPVRISFLGGGTDYPAYYREHGGAILGSSINQYTHLSIKTLKGSFFDHNIRIAYSKVELVKDIHDIEHPSVRECLKFMNMSGNLDIHIFSDLPAKTGLGSSSSFTVGLLNALYALQGRRISKYQLASEACHVEQNLIVENVGSQDQFHAAFGGFNVMEFNASHINVRPLVVSQEKRRNLEEHLLIFYTGITRFAHAIAKEQVENTHKNIPFLKEMTELVHEGEKIFTTLPGDKMIKAFGELLHQGWTLKKKLSSQITTPIIDEIYKAGREEGAYGGKLCGAGGGGFLIFIVPPEKKEKIRNRLRSLMEVTFRFEDEGSTIIYMKD